MIKVILWDLDGTLLDFHKAQNVAIKACFEHFKLGTITDEMIEVYSKINAKYWEKLERGEMTKARILLARFEEFFDLYGIDKTCIPEFEEMYQIRLGDTVSFFPNGYEIITGFKGKYLQCLVTNGTKVTQTRKLKNSKLDEVFDKFFISEDLGAEKPSIDFFKKVFEEIGGYSKDEVIIIGDSLTSDIRGGNNAGIRTCWFNPNHLENKHGEHVDYEIDKLDSLEAILKGIC